MPIVLTVSDATASGHDYRDDQFVAHEYPTRYRNLVRQGEFFVYYRGRRTRTGGTQPQVYIGAGIIGNIRESERVGHLLCDIHAEPFEHPVYFKREDGTYLEPDGSRRGYWQPGVRRIEDSTYAEILLLAEFPAGPPVPTAPINTTSGGIYASSEVARAVELYSRAAVVRRLTDDLPGIDLEEMPFNHPGYDIRTNQRTLEFVEVKGTQAQFPRFLMSDNERRYWADNTSSYAVYSVYGIDLDDSRHVGIRRFTGAPDQLKWLEPHTWLGSASDDDGTELGA